MYLGAPVLFALCQFFPRQCRQFPWYGLVVVAGALALSSLATEVWHLILTQGVMYSCGGMLLYYPIYIFIDEWFVRRKGFAFGIMWAGSGCGGLVGPLVLNWGLAKYGVATFLRGWAVALVSFSPLFPFSSKSNTDLPNDTPARLDRSTALLHTPPSPTTTNLNRLPHRLPRRLQVHHKSHLPCPATRQHHPRTRLLHTGTLPPILRARHRSLLPIRPARRLTP